MIRLFWCLVVTLAEVYFTLVFRHKYEKLGKTGMGSWKIMLSKDKTRNGDHYNIEKIDDKMDREDDELELSDSKHRGHTAPLSKHWYQVLYAVSAKNGWWLPPNWAFTLGWFITFGLQYSALGFFLWNSNPELDTSVDINVTSYDIAIAMFLSYDFCLALWWCLFTNSRGDIWMLRFSFLSLLLTVGSMVTSLYYMWIAGSVIGFSIYIPVAAWLLFIMYWQTAIIYGRYESKKAGLLKQSA